MTTNIPIFVQACIQCLSKIGAAKVPCLVSLAVHETDVNELLRFDCIEIDPSLDGNKL